jgi:hypothetical protein
MQACPSELIQATKSWVHDFIVRCKLIGSSFWFSPCKFTLPGTEVTTVKDEISDNQSRRT